MFKNYILTSLRSIRRNFRFSLINIIGLSFGIACCLAILLYVKDEVSYDKFHKNAMNIYQVVYETSNGMQLAQVPPPVSPLMAEVHPEVVTSARMFGRNLSITVKDNDLETSYEEENVYFADSTIAHILTFDWVSGNPEKLLLEPGKVWISQETAAKYFNDKDPLGKEIVVNGEHLYQVAGVLNDFPSNSHIHFNLLLAYDEMYRIENEQMEKFLRQNFSINWVASHSLTYVLLKDGANPEHVNERFPEMIKNHAPEQLQLGQKFKLVPLTAMHLNEEIMLQPEPAGSMQYIYIFSGIAFLTLLIACFNYINLSTAQSVRRVKEIGMRKTLGARMIQLFTQFFGESILITLLSFLLALVFLNISMPFLEQLTGKTMSMVMLTEPVTLAGISIIFIMTALLGGAYPAFFISRMNVLKSLKNEVKKNSSFFSLRRVLVMVQFAISIMLIAGSILIYRQVQFLQEQPLGFQKEAVLTIPILSQSFNNAFGGVNGALRQRLNTYADEVEKHSMIRAVSFSSSVPGMGTIGRYGTLEGQETDQPQVVNTLSVDYDFIETYNLELISGRNFSKSAGSDHESAFIVNQTAVREYGWINPNEALGKEIDIEGKKGAVIGVVKDFHTTSLHDPIPPLIMEVNIPFFSTMSVVVNTSTMDESIDYLRTRWNTMFPEKAFEFSFLDSALDDLYQNEQRLGNIVGVFAFLAILVSCLGAYGLMIITTQQRMKEIGIRKVLGASILQLVRLMLKESMVLIAIGFAIGIPVAWWWGSGWLENFNYRMPLTPLPFILGGLISMLLVWLVVSLQTLKAARCNPTEVMRNE